MNNLCECGHDHTNQYGVYPDQVCPQYPTECRCAKFTKPKEPEQPKRNYRLICRSCGVEESTFQGFHQAECMSSWVIHPDDLDKVTT